MACLFPISHDLSNNSAAASLPFWRHGATNRQAIGSRRLSPGASKAPAVVLDRARKLDAYADKLSHMLRQKTGKSRKQKRTIKQLGADLTSLGYDGSYNRDAAFARSESSRPRITGARLRSVAA
jgi:hypothetical protein